MRGFPSGQPLVARAGNQVQVVGTRKCDVSRQAGQIPWYRQHRTRPCKKRKDGAPAVSLWEREKLEGWANRLPRFCRLVSVVVAGINWALFSKGKNYVFIGNAGFSGDIGFGAETS